MGLLTAFLWGPFGVLLDASFFATWPPPPEKWLVGIHDFPFWGLVYFSGAIWLVLGRGAILHQCTALECPKTPPTVILKDRYCS